MKEPRISVLMPVFNAERYLREAIQSVLDQTEPSFELLVLDDQSTDQSQSIVREFNDPRVRLEMSSKRLGLAASLNSGMTLARGEFIARMDADDLCRPRRLEQQLVFMSANPNVGLCGSWIRRFGSGRGRTLKLPTEDSTLRTELFFDNPFAHPTVFLRQEFLLTYGLKYDESLRRAEDWELWRCCSRQFKIANLPEVLLDYRVVESSLSSTQRDVQAQVFARLDRESLKELGIEPTDIELNRHRAFCFGAAHLDFELGDYLPWIQRLNEANARARIYPEREFLRSLSQRWYSLCRTSSYLGRDVERVYGKGVRELGLEPAGVSDRVKLALRCAIRYRTPGIPDQSTHTSSG